MGRPTFNPVRDLISGAIMAATSVPQLIAYAETVGYAGYRGLATAGPPLMAWGLVTGSPYMNSGVTSITALMARSDLNGGAYLSEEGEEKYVELVAAYSIYVGVASIVLALVGFGQLASYVPKSVRSGFKWGCAVGVLVSALPNGLFNNGGKDLSSFLSSSPLWDELVKTLRTQFPQAPGAVGVTGVVYSLAHPWLWSVPPTILFVIGTWFVMKGKDLLPSFLPPGSEVILATALATLHSMYGDYPGGVVGEIPTLAPDAGIQVAGFTLPIELMDYRTLLDAPVADRMGGYPLLIITATLFAAVNFLSIVGIASGFESEEGIGWSPPRELAAQGVSCLVAGMVGSAPVSGSLSRSLVSRMTGTTSQLACIVTAIIWIVALPYMGIMSPTPKAALSAVIVSAVLEGVCWPKDLIYAQGWDFVVAWGTGLLTALTSPTLGFGMGLILYIATAHFRSSLLIRGKFKTV
jgi:SulP family sulfate permease